MCKYFTQFNFTCKVEEPQNDCVRTYRLHSLDEDRVDYDSFSFIQGDASPQIVYAHLCSTYAT